MTAPAIQVEGLSKRFRLYSERRSSLKERFVRGRGDRYREFWALRDIDLQVDQGTTLGLIGHNGSGKSTLLKTLAGIYRPTSGSVVSHGRISALLELGAGFHGELSGRENIYLNGAILGLSRKQIDASMEEIIDFAGIDAFIDSPVKVYSSGMYVRLGFSIAVTLDPEILIVDEIIAVGDEEFQRKCFDYLFELRRRGTTIVLVSHSMGLVGDLCDTVAWLDHGKVQAVGDSREVIDQYLQRVNDQEAEHAAEHGESGTGSARSRRGSGEIRVLDVKLADAAGQPTTFLTADAAGTVRLRYQADADVPAAVFGLGLVHESGVTVAGPNSGSHGPYRVEAGVGVVSFTFDRVSLAPGTYEVTTAVVDRGHTFDFVDRGFTLRVRADHAIDEPGLTRAYGSWRIEPASAGPASLGLAAPSPAPDPHEPTPDSRDPTPDPHDREHASQ